MQQRIDRDEERLLRQYPFWRDLGLVGGNPLPITFPGQGLRTRAMIALNPDYTQDYTTWNWVDITRDFETGSSIVRWEQQVNIIAGGRANSPLVDASTCKFRATNDKRFSRRNPLGPYYGQLSEYTPLWIQLDYGQGWKDRYFGFIHDFSKAWDRSGNDSYIDLTARGPFHRIGKSKPLKSPIFRAISGVAADDFKPQSFWPAEDASESTQIASALPNQGPVFPSGPITYGQQGPEGALSVIQTGVGFTATFPVPPYTDTDRWAVTWIMKIDSRPASNTTTLLTVHTTGGDLPTWRLILDTTFPDAILRWNAYDAADVLQYDVFFFPSTSPTDDDFFGQWFMMTFGVWHPTAFPGNAQSTMAVDNGRDKRFHATNGALFAGHVGTITDFTFTVDSVFTGIGVALGEFGVFVDPNFRPFNAAAARANGDALHGYELERAITRLRRICREERIPFFSTAPVGESAPCAPQQAGNLLNVLRVPEAADGGTLYEYKFGLAYKAPMEYQNQPILLTLDAALSQIKDVGTPIDNDLDFVNRWTVNRQGGSSATVEGRKGESGVTLTDNELVYENSKTVPVGFDSQLIDYAGRLVQQSTVDEDRWPTLAFKLEASPELIDSWIGFTFGGRVKALNLYEEIGVTTLDQIHRGHTEAWNSLTWAVTLNVSPASVFNTLEVDGDFRIDGDTSTLVSAITDSASSFFVETSSESETWTRSSPSPEDFPLDIKLYPGTGEAISSGGEVIRLDQLRSSFFDSFTRSVADSFGTAETGQVYTQIQGAAADIDVNGAQGVFTHSALDTKGVRIGSTVLRNFDFEGQAQHSVVPTGGTAEFAIRGRVIDGSNFADMRLFFTTTNEVTIAVREFHNGNENVDGFPVAIGAAANSLVNWRVRLWDSMIKAKVWLAIRPEPLHWMVELPLVHTNFGFVDIFCGIPGTTTNVLPINTQVDTLHMTQPQNFIVSQRAVNGIVKAHAAGTSVRVDPMSVLG